MMERGVRGAVTVRALGCCVVVVVLLLAVVAEGQARVGHPPGRASVGKGALAPVTFTYTGGEQTYTVPAGVESVQVQAVGANGGDGSHRQLRINSSRRDRRDGDRRPCGRCGGSDRAWRHAVRRGRRHFHERPHVQRRRRRSRERRRRGWRDRGARVFSHGDVLYVRGPEPADAPDRRRRWRRCRRMQPPSLCAAPPMPCAPTAVRAARQVSPAASGDRCRPTTRQISRPSRAARARSWLLAAGGLDIRLLPALQAAPMAPEGPAGARLAMIPQG